MREERRGWVPPVKFRKAWLFPLSVFFALPLPGRDVLSSCVSNVIAVSLKPDETKCFFFTSGCDGVTLSSYPRLLSLQPQSSTPVPDCWDSLCLIANSSHAGRKKNAPPSAPSHLLFIVCFLTFISNSFHWHMKSWQQKDSTREGWDLGFKSVGIEGSGCFPPALLVFAVGLHPFTNKKTADTESFLVFLWFHISYLVIP